MPNPALPVTRLNRIVADSGLDAIQIDSPLTFADPADRTAFAEELGGAGSVFVFVPSDGLDAVIPPGTTVVITSGTTFAAGRNLGLPPAAGYAAGKTMMVVDSDQTIVNGSASISLAPQTPNSGPNMVLTFPGEFAILMSNGANRWDLVAGSLDVLRTAEFSSSLGSAAFAGVESFVPAGAARSPGYACFQRIIADATNGDAFTAGGWRTVPLDTEQADTLGGFSVASNAITIAAPAAGVWYVHASIPVSNSGFTTVRLRRTNNTAATLLRGQGGYAWSGSSDAVMLGIFGRITLAAGDVIEVQVFSQANGNISYGGSVLTSGESTVRGVITFEKE